MWCGNRGGVVLSDVQTVFQGGKVQEYQGQIRWHHARLPILTPLPLTFPSSRSISIVSNSPLLHPGGGGGGVPNVAFNFKKCQHRMSLHHIFPNVPNLKKVYVPYQYMFTPMSHVTISPLSYVEFKKCPSRPVEFRYQGPLYTLTPIPLIPGQHSRRSSAHVRHAQSESRGLLDVGSCQCQCLRGTCQVVKSNKTL